MTNGQFEPFSESMKQQLREQYNSRAERYALLDKMRRSEMITVDEYNQQKKDLDDTIAKLEKIDREFHIFD